MDFSFDEKKQCVVRYLGSIRESHNRISYLRNKIEQIESALDIRAVNFDERVSGGTFVDLVPGTIDRLYGLRNELNREIDRAIRRYRQAFRLCSDYQNRWMVWLHVVEGMLWREVAVSTHCSESKVRSMADHGYMEIYDAMPDFD